MELHQRSVATSRPRVATVSQALEVKWQREVVLFSGELAASGEPTNSKYHSLPAYGTEPYQPLPPPPAGQLTTGSVLRSCDTAALDAIQGEADSFPYNGSVKARYALFLGTELRSGSMLTGFLGGARVTTLMDGQIDLNADPGAL